MSVHVTTLSENTAGRSNLLVECGLSILVETEKTSALLDTGSGISVAHNVDTLDINLTKIDRIVLSHGHKEIIIETQPPFMVSYNITTKCNLKCKHYYSNSVERAAPDELSTDEAFRPRDDLSQWRTGLCGQCTYRDSCSGCCGRAYEETGDIMAADSGCWLMPGLGGEHSKP